MMQERPDFNLTSSLIEQAGVSILTVDLNGIITGLNPAAEKLYGYPASDILGQPFSQLVLVYSRPSHERIMSLVLREGQPWDVNFECLTRDIGPRLMRHIISPIKDESGVIIGASLIGFDTHDMMAYQRSLQEERDLLEAILETTNDAIIMIGRDNRVVTINPQFETFFSLAAHETVGQPLDKLVEFIRQRDDLPTDLANLLLSLGADSNQNAGGDFEIGTPAQRVLVWYSAPVHTPDGAHVGRLYAFRDVTQERQIDRMKTEFVSLVSHELRTPLTAIRGFAEFMLEGDAGPLSTDVRDYVQIIQLNAERLSSMINDILDLTRIEAGRIELRPDHHDLNDILAVVLLAIQPQTEKRHQQLFIDVPEDMPLVWVDQARIAQVMTNLLDNAIKYTDDGGLITVRAQIAGPADLPDGANPDVMLPAVLVSVEDTGQGIVPEDQANLFNRFYRSSQVQQQQIQGSGLGLAIVKSFVELHGGKIWLHSELGKGTVFYFTIPLPEGR